MAERCIRELDALPAEAGQGVATIGNFDGVHRGHQRILQLARALADNEHRPVVALTFDPLPEQVMAPSRAPLQITLPDQKCRFLREAGVDWVVIVPASPSLLAMDPDEFAREVVAGRLAPRHLVEGPDFRFGRGRSGTIETLRRAAPQLGFEVHMGQPLEVDVGEGPQRVSSTLIRRLLLAGRVGDAARCLGRPFTLRGRVVGGHQRGRSLEFPTANVGGGRQICPGDGVYAGWAEVADRRRPAAISVGDKPTFGPSERTVEAFLLGAEGDFYGQMASVSFLRRLRDQVRFDSAEALKAQIAKDVQRVREICQ